MSQNEPSKIDQLLDLLLDALQERLGGSLRCAVVDHVDRVTDRHLHFLLVLLICAAAADSPQNKRGVV